MPLITRRSSTRALPRVSVGRCGLIFENCAFVSQNWSRLIYASFSEAVNHATTFVPTLLWVRTLGQNHNNITGFSGINGRNTGFFGTVRGRGGIAFDRLLVYGTGGVAFGSNNNEWGNTFIGTIGGVPTIFTTNANNNTRVGYAVGAGVEYAL